MHTFIGLGLVVVVCFFIIKFLQKKCFYSCEELDQEILTKKGYDHQEYLNSNQSERHFDTVNQD